MAIDTYAPCPGGTGKKIKFCCADLVGDLAQLDTLVEGDQISAALDQVRRLDERTPGRACLMATRTKLELASKRFAEAAATSRAFLQAFPDNPLALGQSAVTDAIAGRVQEAAAAFDKAREAAGREVSPEVVRIAATLVQAAAQTGHVGFAQGVVDWLADRALGSEDERRLLATIVGSSGVPPALRTRVRLEPLSGDSPWRFEFDAALKHAAEWRLAKALTTFRSLKGMAGESRELFTNIAIVCEMLARPVEAAEAWATVARLRDVPRDDAVEAIGRAIALETEADPDRSPVVRFASRAAPLHVPAGEEGVTALELLDDKIRHAGCFDQASFDRTTWVSRGAVPPRSAWRVYESDPAGGRPARLLATLLVFGRQTDREPEAVLQGFAADVEAARPAVETVLGCQFAADDVGADVPATTPTNWLLGSQFRLRPPAAPAAAAAGQPSAFDDLLRAQSDALWGRFLDVWPDTPLPELLGKSPRQALGDRQLALRVEALVTEGEATSRRVDACDAWAAMRDRLGMPRPAQLDSPRPLEDGVPPMRWHRLDMQKLGIDELRGVFVTAADAGFERAAERAAEALAARADATPADRWEALGLLEERATSSVRKLEILAELRKLAATLKANDGMLDVAELRVRMQRGDEAATTRLFEHLRRDHSRDQQVLQALAEVLMEAGVDLSAIAGRAATGPAAAPAAAAAEAGKLWTPGGAEPTGGGEKKVIWTPT